jgi:positive regulator of sigma E activity
MDCTAKVIKAEKKTALVRVARINCGECGACGLLARKNKDSVEFSVENRVGARADDEVILHLPSKRLYLSFLIAFGLPVLAIPAGYFVVMAIIGLTGNSIPTIAIIAAVLAGFIAFWRGVKLAGGLNLAPYIKGIKEAAAGPSRVLQ